MNLISLLQTGTIVCLSFTVVFFIISIVLFFVFDIRFIFNIRRGRAKRKTVEEMQKANNQTGRLRAKGKTLTSRLDSKKSHAVSQFSVLENNSNTENETSASSVTSALEKEPPVQYSVGSPYSFANNTLENEQNNANDFGETSILNQVQDLPIEETSLPFLIR